LTPSASPPHRPGPLDTPALATQGLSLERGGEVFARLPALSLPPSQQITLIGPSGSGKTTAILALTGIRPPHSGALTIAGTDLWSLDTAARDRFRGQRIGLVFQSFHLIDAVTVLENLTLAATSAGLKADIAHIEGLMEQLAISDLRHRRARALSTGQAQRVAVARALVNRPALVIADEPTSALDDQNAHALLALLKECAARENAALLIATHDRRILESSPRTVEMERLA